MINQIIGKRIKSASVKSFIYKRNIELILLNANKLKKNMKYKCLNYPYENQKILFFYIIKNI